MEPTIPPEPIRVLPPGPFPPYGEERRGTVDLGIRLRDMLYDGTFVTQTARQALAGTVSRLAGAPELLYRAQKVIDLLIDTWPLGALIDDARETWTRGPDARALAALERGAEVASATLGWPLTLDRRWPLPDERAIREIVGQGEVVGPGSHVAVRRGDRDGAPAVSVALGAPLVGREGIALPSVLDVHGDELVARRDALLAAIGRGEAVAVRTLTPVPFDAASQEAMEAIRNAAPAQRAFERFGQAGLLTREVVTFDELLSDAPAQRVGARLARTCSVLVLPRLTEEGRVEGMGVLVWDLPWRPVRIAAALATLLSRLDEPRTPAELARSVGLERQELDRALAQLAELGAIRPA